MNQRNQILMVADDLGASPAVNQAVHIAHLEGGLDAASLMLGQPGSGAAVDLAVALPSLQIGWHVHVCDSQPLTRRSWPWGRSPVLAALALTLWPAARRFVRDEVRRQWSAFVDSGLPCRFINGHHHLHVHPVVLREIERLVPPGDRPWLRGFGLRRFGRRGRPRARQRLEPWFSPCLQHRLQRRHGWVLSDSLWGLDRLHAMQPAEVLEVLPTLSQGLHEFLFHPRATSGDTDFAALIRLRNWRQTLGRPD